MKIKDYKCKCEHDDFFFADKDNQKGIYCSYCGKWLKWADKDEQNLTLKEESCENCISRPRGKWLVKDLYTVKCSKCGFEFDITRCSFVKNMNFCPNCGQKKE